MASYVVMEPPGRSEKGDTPHFVRRGCALPVFLGPPPWPAGPRAVVLFGKLIPDNMHYVPYRRMISLAPAVTRSPA